MASAIPSITPIEAIGAPSVIVRKSGTIGYASSLAESLASETQTQGAERSREGAAARRARTRRPGADGSGSRPTAGELSTELTRSYAEPGSQAGDRQPRSACASGWAQ